MSAVTVDKGTDVVVVDSNPTVRRLVDELLATAGLSVVCVERIEDLAVGPGVFGDSAPVVVLDLTFDPAAAIDLPQLLPAPLRNPARTVITSVKPALVATFAPDRNQRPWDALIERPFAPATLIGVLERWFQDLSTLREQLTADAGEVSSHADDWARLGDHLRDTEQRPTERLTPASTSSASGMRRERSGSASMRRRAESGLEDPARARMETRRSEVSGLVDMSEEAEVVDERGTDELDIVSEHDLEPVSSSDGQREPVELDPIDLDDLDSAIISVDVSFDNFDDSLVENLVEQSPMTGAIEVVTQFEADADEVRLRSESPVASGTTPSAVPTTAEAPIVDTSGLDASPRRRSTLSREVGQGVRESEARDEALRADPHRAATRVAAAINVALESSRRVADVREDDIEELPDDFIVAMEQAVRPSRHDAATLDGAALDLSMAELDTVPPPAPAKPVHLSEGHFVAGSAELFHLADILRLMRHRGQSGVIHTTTAELGALIFFEGDLVRWVEVLQQDGRPTGLPAFLLACGLIDDAALRDILGEADTRSGAQLPELLAERGLGTLESIYEALHWRATHLLWEVLARRDTTFRVDVQLSGAQHQILEARPALQIGIEAALLGFYRTCPDHTPTMPRRRRSLLVTEQAMAHRFSVYGLLPEERWVLDVLAEPRTVDGLLELAADVGYDVDHIVTVVGRLRDFGLVVSLPR